jgi:SH3-like domain-containing protein
LAWSPGHAARLDFAHRRLLNAGDLDTPYVEFSLAQMRVRLHPWLVVLVVVFALGAALPTVAASETGLPLPRFVSLRSNEVNLRTGPGTQYPVTWIYRRQMLPIEIIAEYRNWRKIRDWQGDEGWVHKNMLSGRRSIIVMGDAQSILAAPSASSPVLVRAEAGVVGHLVACPDEGPFCRVRIGSREGWLERTGFWGAYPDEIFP